MTLRDHLAVRKWGVKGHQNLLTSERSEEVPFLRGVLWGVERTRVPPFAVFWEKVVFVFGVGWCRWGKLGFGRSPTELLRRFLKSAIYRGNLFSGQNAKTGPVGARFHVEGGLICFILFYLNIYTIILILILNCIKCDFPYPAAPLQ